MLFDISNLAGSKGMGEHSNDLFSDHKRKAWHALSKNVARCDFAPNKWRLNSRGIFFFSLWKASIYGMTLTDIKEDKDMPDFFAKNISDFIHRFFNISAHSVSSASSSFRDVFKDWILITPPPRRHIEENFAVRTARKIEEYSGIRFFDNVSKANNRQRVMAEFELIELPPAQNIICFDDIVTTGSTFQAMNRLLQPFNKNVIYLCAINNKL